MEINNNIQKPNPELKESQLIEQQVIAEEDGTYYSIEQISQLLPDATEIMHLIFYLQINKNILTETEQEIIKIKIERMKKSHYIKLNKDLKDHELLEENKT